MNWFTPIYPFFAVLGFGLGWKHEKLQYFSFFFISGSAPVHTYLSNFGRFRIGLGWKHEKLQYFSFFFISGSAPVHTYLSNFCLLGFLGEVQHMAKTVFFPFILFKGSAPVQTYLPFFGGSRDNCQVTRFFMTLFAIHFFKKVRPGSNLPIHFPNVGRSNWNIFFLGDLVCHSFF